MSQSNNMIAVNQSLIRKRAERFPGLAFAQNMYSPDATDEMIAVRVPDGSIYWVNAIYRKVPINVTDGFETVGNALLVDEAKILDYAARYGSHDDNWFAMVELWHYLVYPDSACIASTTMALFRIASDGGLDILKEQPDNMQQFVLMRDNEVIHEPSEHKIVHVAGGIAQIGVPESTDQPPPETERMTKFEKALEHLINVHSMENGSDTPDFLLAQYLRGCLENFNTVVKARSRWYGRPDEMNAALGLNNPDDPIGTEVRE